MANTYYTYSIADDFPYQKMNTDRLALEINATVLAALLVGIESSGDSCAISFTEPLDTDDKATLDGVVDAHSGDPLTKVVFHASSLLVGLPQETTSSDWSDVGGVVTNVGFFVKDINMALGRIVGQVKTTGAGADLRILKQDGSVLLGPVALPDTQGAWVVFSETTNSELPLDVEEVLYVVQARLAGATSLFFRFTSFTLLEIVT